MIWGDHWPKTPAESFSHTITKMAKFSLHPSIPVMSFDTTLTMDYHHIENKAPFFGETHLPYVSCIPLPWCNLTVCHRKLPGNITIRGMDWTPKKLAPWSSYHGSILKGAIKHLPFYHAVFSSWLIGFLSIFGSPRQQHYFASYGYWPFTANKLSKVGDHMWHGTEDW